MSTTVINVAEHLPTIKVGSIPVGDCFTHDAGIFMRIEVLPWGISSLVEALMITYASLPDFDLDDPWIPCLCLRNNSQHEAGLTAFKSSVEVVPVHQTVINITTIESPTRKPL